MNSTVWRLAYHKSDVSSDRTMLIDEYENADRGGKSSKQSSARVEVLHLK